MTPANTTQSIVAISTIKANVGMNKICENITLTKLNNVKLMISKKISPKVFRLFYIKTNTSVTLNILMKNNVFLRFNFVIILISLFVVLNVL